MPGGVAELPQAEATPKFEMEAVDSKWLEYFIGEQKPLGAPNGLEVAPTGWQTYLIWFAHRYIGFRLAELTALTESMAGLQAGDFLITQPACMEGKPPSVMNPFYYLHVKPHVTEAAVQQIADRAVLARMILRLWGEGGSLADLITSIQERMTDVRREWSASQLTWKMNVESFGTTVKHRQRRVLIPALDEFAPRGKVLMEGAEVEMAVILCDRRGNGGLPEDIPFRLYFGVQLAGTGRRRVDAFQLSKRAYIGPTSMDAELSFVMCNMAQVKRGHLVFDPYVGTGSVLVAAAQFGAHTMGADIDIRVVRDGRPGADGENCNVWSNFQQYDLPTPLGLLRGDSHRLPFRDDLDCLFNAIICDPPYGLRAGSRTSSAPQKEAGEAQAEGSDPLLEAGVVRAGSSGPQTADAGDTRLKGSNPPAESSQSQRAGLRTYPEWHRPATHAYSMSECLRDLLDLAARLLVLGGRLVFFMPVSPETYDEGELPRHPCLAAVSNCEQPLTSRYSRRLITMQKVEAYSPEAVAAFHLAQGPASMAIDRIADIVFARRSERDKGSETAMDKFRGKRH